MTVVSNVQAGIHDHAINGDSPEWTALVGALRRLFDGVDPAHRVAARRRLKRGVYRLEIDGNAPWRTIIAKRLEPATAQRCRLLAERWLPELGLGEHCPQLLGVASDPEGQVVWHLYEDVGQTSLADRPDLRHVDAILQLVASLHVRAAHHAVLPDVRRYGAEFGVSYMISNVGDALDALDALDAANLPAPPEGVAAAIRLRERLRDLLADASRRARVFAEAEGPSTLLHGDLWTTNCFVHRGRARLIDWDRVGVGPFSYDLSTLVMRFPLRQRASILQRYRQLVECAGWRPPSAAQLAVLLDTAERARYANRVIWPALALVREQADWGFQELIEVERWFEALDATPYSLL